MKLKTLKDLFMEDRCKELVKKEAIKWVKANMNDKGNIIPDSQDVFWMERFNITSEDLK